MRTAGQQPVCRIVLAISQCQSAYVSPHARSWETSVHGRTVTRSGSGPNPSTNLHRRADVARHISFSASDCDCATAAPRPRLARLEQVRRVRSVTAALGCGPSAGRRRRCAGRVFPRDVGGEQAAVVRSRSATRDRSARRLPTDLGRRSRCSGFITQAAPGRNRSRRIPVWRNQGAAGKAQLESNNTRVRSRVATSSLEDNSNASGEQ
jgi:hypothetical protein